jgi:two-component system, NarL family, response regulator LiaR
MTEPLRVLLVEDHRMFADAIKLLLEAAEGMNWAGTAESGEQAVESCADKCPDVILMDIELPGIDGIEATRRVREVCPDVRVVAITAFPHDKVMARAIEAGACGFVTKTQSGDQLIDVFRRAAAGEIVVPAGDLAGTLTRLRAAQDARSEAQRLLARLTGREIEILQALADGGSVAEVAESLFISLHTVHSHMGSILTKLEVHSKLEALLLALRHGVIRLHASS